MKIKKIPLGLPQQDVIQRYSKSNNRLIILVIELSLGDFSVIYLEFYIFALLIFVNVMQGFFGTLTEPMNNQNEELDLHCGGYGQEIFDRDYAWLAATNNC